MSGLGLGIPEAARMGVFVHGVAGDLAVAETGADGVVASDILQMLPAAMRQTRDGGPWAERYAGPRIV